MKYEFETQRLGFRQWEAQDKEPFSRMNSDPIVMEYFPNKLTRTQSDEFIEKINNHFNKFGYSLWAVEIKDTHEFIGFVGLYTASFKSDFTPCVEIGWRLDKQYWNKGYATEGAKACLNYGFKKLGLKEIYSFTSLINIKSINVMKKIGLIEQSQFEHPNIDENNKLRLHVLYKIDKPTYDKK